jgi:hypothetical protein
MYKNHYPTLENQEEKKGRPKKVKKDLQLKKI